MKYSPTQFARFQKSQDASMRAALIFGPDEGLVRERAKSLLTAIVDDPGDPFRVCEFDAPALMDDPARLADEAAAISMMGGRRAVRITNAGDRTTKIFKEFLDTLPGDGFVIITGGDLTAKGSLRKLFEGHKAALALACFSDSAETRDALIDSILVKAGHHVSPDARTYLNTHLGNDRMVSRQELEKLALYKGDDDTPITLEDAALNIGDSASRAFDEAGSAALNGQFPALLTALGKAYEGGDNPVGVLRLVSRRLQRMHLVASMAETGNSMEAGFKALRPPAFSREANELRRLLHRWNAGRLGDALKIVNEAEQLCKSTGMPAEAICTRALMRLAGAARQSA
jgi:DNA polymerase-3 subunit delta